MSRPWQAEHHYQPAHHRFLASKLGQPLLRLCDHHVRRLPHDERDPAFYISRHHRRAATAVVDRRFVPAGERQHLVRTAPTPFYPSPPLPLPSASPPRHPLRCPCPLSPSPLLCLSSIWQSSIWQSSHPPALPFSCAQLHRLYLPRRIELLDAPRIGPCALCRRPREGVYAALP